MKIIKIIKLLLLSECLLWAACYNLGNNLSLTLLGVPLPNFTSSLMITRGRHCFFRQINSKTWTASTWKRTGYSSQSGWTRCGIRKLLQDRWFNYSGWLGWEAGSFIGEEWHITDGWYPLFYRWWYSRWESCVIMYDTWRWRQLGIPDTGKLIW